MNRTILLVEDDENDVFFLKHAFSKAKIEADLFVAQDGLEALAYLRGEGKYADRDAFPFPELIFLDLNLPYVHGLQVLEELPRKLRKNIVVILTSSGAESDMESAYECGANSYLLKPATVEERLEMVKDLERYWFRLNRNPWRPTDSSP